MDALKFIEERNRMCDYYNAKDAYPGCEGCPASQMACSSVRYVTAEYIEAVERWAQEHPRKTRQSNLLEMFPTARLDCHGVLMACPANIDASNFADNGACINPTIGCDECRREFWMQEVE